MTFKPFSEDALYEQNSSSDLFYASGSSQSIGEDPGTFSNSLASKEKISISCQVVNKVRMLHNSSSVYYYNFASRQWNIPTKSVDDHIGPFDKFAVNTNWAPPSGSGIWQVHAGSLFTEDAKLFDAYGKIPSSGSGTPYKIPTVYNKRTQTNEDLENDVSAWPEIGTSDAHIYTNGMTLITNRYPKSIQSNPMYEPSNDELFVVSNNDPFLIEKIVLDIPMCMGSSWFEDRTMTVPIDQKGSTYQGKARHPEYDYSSNGALSFDAGGPAMTVSLLCYRKFGKQFTLDLIGSASITTLEDTRKTWHIRKQFWFGNLEALFISSVGFDSPNVTISPNNGQEFTGSVITKFTPAVSNGIEVIYYTGMDNFTGEILSQSMSSSMQSEYLAPIAESPLAPGTYFKEYWFPTNIDPLGRNSKGFEPSGGSIFGGEYVYGVKPQTTITYNRPPNPFKIDDIDKRNEILATINGLNSNVSYLYKIARLTYNSGKESPFLMMPGDKLVLAMSKTRPAVSASKFDISSSGNCDIGKGTLTSYIQATGSISDGHDVVFNTGSLNITMYGSYVKEGNRYIR